MDSILGNVDISWMDDEKKKYYAIISTILGHVYAQVNWRKVSGTKIATDVFEHRIKNSAHKPTISTFVSKLCNQLSIQALHMDGSIMMQAMQYEQDLLRIIRTESQLCVMLAKSAAKHIKANRKNNKEKNEK